MSAAPFKRSGPSRWFAYGFGILLTVAVGLLLLTWKGGPLERGSYDVLFRMQKEHVPANLVLVYLDSEIKRKLGQPADQPLDRRFYARLVERLAAEGAQLVLFDILLDQPAPDPATDEALARAFKQHGRVVLVAESIKQLHGNQGNYLIDSTLPPIETFANAAAGYGVANVAQDGDFCVRRIDLGLGGTPSAGLVAARLLRPDLKVPVETCWLNYYCAPNDLIAVTLDRALGDGVPPGYFKDKVVVIGAKPEARVAGADREDFGSPYSKTGAAGSSGAAVHALTLLNLARGDFLRRLNATQELAINLIWGTLLCIVLLRLTPWGAIVAAIAAAVLLTYFAAYLQLRYHFWFAWVVPAVCQTAIAFVWAVGYRYGIESARSRRLRRAFAAYTSPYMADRIANSDFDLAPGGKEVEVTVMFTDLQGFTQISESLSPAALSRILVTYFNKTTSAILDQDGMVIKFIGDAVLAEWGAPLPEPKPEERAVLAALTIQATTQQPIEGLTLRTRIGINTGLVLAGNLGSEIRFDYTVIGDAINVAQRLERLNKQFGTQILVSEGTRAKLNERFQVRSLGRFVLPGKTTAVGVCEVLAMVDPKACAPPWLTVFGQALDLFTKAQFQASEDLFRKVIELRGGKDGPSEYYLGLISKKRGTFQSQTWDGLVHLESK